MQIRVRSLEPEEGYHQPRNHHLHYDIIVYFTPEDLQSMHWARGKQTEQVIDAIGEGVKSELRRIEERNKRKL